jgi:hypothetical protein
VPYISSLIMVRRNLTDNLDALNVNIYVGYYP